MSSLGRFCPSRFALVGLGLHCMAHPLSPLITLLEVPHLIHTLSPLITLPQLPEVPHWTRVARILGVGHWHFQSTSYFEGWVSWRGCTCLWWRGEFWGWGLGCQWFIGVLIWFSVVGFFPFFPVFSTLMVWAGQVPLGALLSGIGGVPLDFPFGLGLPFYERGLASYGVFPFSEKTMTKENAIHN